MEERSFFYRYCIVIPTSCPKIIQYVESVLKQNDFDVQIFEDKKKKYICISQNNEKRMFEQAQTLKLKKPKNTLSEEDENTLKIYLDQRIIDLEKNEYFEAEKSNEYLPPKIYYDLYNIDIKNKESNKRFGLGLFTESEMLLIEKSILENIPINDVKKFSELLTEEAKKDTSIQNKLLTELHLKKNKKEFIDENSFFDTLLNYHVIKDHFPLHISDISIKINKKMLSLYTPYNLARSYLNDDVALYFAWTFHYTKFVLIPGVLSLIIFMLAKLLSNKYSELLYMIYALGVTIWVQFFIIYWRRTESVLKVEWNNDSNEYEKEDKRKEFVGEVVKSIITGKYELRYSLKKKFINYLISGSITFIFILIALLINVIALNLRDLIPEEQYSYLNIPRYKKYSKKKEFLEIGSTAAKLITPIKTIILTVLGVFFDKVNIILTDYENHKSNAVYNNSYILKKFIFESINYFFDILFIAFALNDLNETTKTIKSFLFMNEILRIFSETIFPIIKNSIYMGIHEDKITEKRLIQGEKIDKNEILRQAGFSKFNSYDEFYPLIQEFCFLTLFACCVPLTPILLLITNSLEIRSDVTKVCLITRRPEVVRKKNIGAWKYIIEFIGIMSIFTNIMFCYIYNHSIGESKYSIMTFTLGEHLLILFIVILRFFIPLSAKWVKIYKLRKEYKEKNILSYLMKEEK